MHGNDNRSTVLIEDANAMGTAVLRTPSRPEQHRTEAANGPGLRQFACSRVKGGPDETEKAQLLQ